MTGNFMQDWMSLLVAFTLAIAPFQLAYSITKWIFGKDTPPGGCIIVVLLLLVAGIPFGIYIFNHYHVVPW